MHRLLATEVIIVSSNIIFTCIVTTLHLDDDKWFCTGVRKTMEMVRRNIASLIGSEHTNLLHLLEVWMTDIYGCNTRYDRPVFTPTSMRLERETLSWVDDELLDLEECRVLEDIIHTPWTIPHFEISSFCYLFWKF